MYYPNRYKNHNTALNKLVIRFNNCAESGGFEVRMFIRKIENFRDDGGFILGNRQVLFDFEKRFNYYPSINKFKYKELGQFERKLIKKEINLSIQCSTDEKGILVSWHEDLLKEKKIFLNSKTRKSYETNAKRFTSLYKEFDSINLNDFVESITYALENNIYNFSSFKLENKLHDKSRKKILKKIYTDKEDNQNFEKQILSKYEFENFDFFKVENCNSITLIGNAKKSIIKFDPIILNSYREENRNKGNLLHQSLPTTKEEIDEIVKLYSKGKDLMYLEKYFQRSRKTIIYHLNNRGVTNKN